MPPSGGEQHIPTNHVTIHQLRIALFRMGGHSDEERVLY